MSELYLKELPLAVNTKVQMIVTTSCHHGIKIWAFKHCVAVARGGRFYVNPVINGKIRRGNKQNKKTAELFCRLNWNFISSCCEKIAEHLIIVSCQGYTFELELNEDYVQKCSCRSCKEKLFTRIPKSYRI